jgi:hypothetical protein
MELDEMIATGLVGITIGVFIFIVWVVLSALF